MRTCDHVITSFLEAISELLPPPRFRFRQKVDILLLAILPAHFQAAETANRFHFQNPGCKYADWRICIALLLIPENSYLRQWIAPHATIHFVIPAGLMLTLPLQIEGQVL